MSKEQPIKGWIKETPKKDDKYFLRRPYEGGFIAEGEERSNNQQPNH